MQRKPGSGGRQKRISGSGSVFRRGSGLGTGPVGSGGGFGGSSGSSGDRDGRGGGSMGLIALLIAYLLGRGGSGGNGKRKGGCLSRIILLLVILALGYMVVQCVAGDMDGTGGYDGSSDIQLIEAEATPTPKPQLAQTQAVAADTTVSNLAREKRTKIRGGGQDVYTIMVYMCGTDLESNYGMATSDINEMLHADLSDKVNIIVETGGADKWQNTVISSKVNQIYQVKNEGILRLESDFGKKAMTKAETLTEFIQYCEANFPADRYALIMWDHGGGSNTGYGYDQKFPNGSMTLDVFNNALKDAGCTFDFIGFDACLMATLETAMVAEQYSDYFIASEETEPGCGWYYTNWLTQLSRNTSMDTVSIGKTIIDDYTAACRQQSSSNQTTLSLIDLAELSGTVPEAFNKFASSTVELIDSDSYTVVSNARSRAKEFSSGINQIDLINFADNMGTPEAKALAEALRGKGCTTYFHWEAPAEERGEVTRKAAQADWFIASANGITRSGKIVNIDGTGNRVASMLFGPKNVALIIGKNKFAETMDECMDRIKAVACAKNAQRLGLSTPCAVAGRCVDCFSKERICSVTTIIEAKPGAISEMHLILVDEVLGY